MKIIISIAIAIMPLFCFAVGGARPAKVRGQGGYMKDEAKGSATISGKLSFLQPGEQVYVAVYKHGYSFEDFFVRKDTLRVAGDSFAVRIPVPTDQTYVTLNFPEHPNNAYTLYYIEASDAIRMKESDGVTLFSGKGSGKFTAWYALNELRKTFNADRSTNTSVAPDSLARLIFHFKQRDALRAAELACLAKHKEELSVKAYSNLRADVILGTASEKMFYLSFCESSGGGIPAEYRVAWKQYLDADWRKLMAGDGRGREINELSGSSFFCSFISHRFYQDSCLFVNRPYRLDDELNYIMKNFSGDVRERLYAYAVVAKRNRSIDNYPALLEKGLIFIQSADFSSLLGLVKASRIRGAQAPDFAFPDTAGVVHHLSEFKGKVVVVDTWHWGCGACRGLAPALRTVEERFRENKNVVFLSICCVTNKEQWMLGIHNEIYSNKDVLNLWVDADENITEGIPFLKSFFWMGDPNLLLVDKQGKWMDNPLIPNVDDGKDLESRINKALELN